MEKKKWSDLWLSYDRITELGGTRTLIIEGFDAENRIIKSAAKELGRGLKGLVGTELVAAGASANADSAKEISFVRESSVVKEGYEIACTDSEITVKAGDENGILYGVFALLRKIAMGVSVESVNEKSSPSNPLRMMNHWDNMDGSIERGYSGESFFFENDEIIINDRTVDYARFMASIGINAIAINNVNVKGAATYLITDRFFDKVKELQDIFADYGIKLYLTINFASPIEIGGLDTCDPLDETVISWWKDKAKEVFEKLPGIGGFLVKADSEGRPGPFTYGRTQADGANMLADAVEPFGGIIIWRCFVYNCTQDWRDYKTDRARAGYDYFKEFDGAYRDNVILQIKNGPMDFQVREPVSPLLGGLTKTNQMLEVQLAQEYTGHQIDLFYLIPWFKEVLGFHTYCKEGCDTVADIISGKTMGNKNAGFAAVINTGNDYNWTGNDLAAANLYGFGRLAYDMSLTAEDIAREWVRLTYASSMDKKSEDVLVGMLLDSGDIYEKYTAPLGIGWMVTPNTHYGPSVDGYEYSRWGTYHRADHHAIGVDRSDKGTGYAQQYYKKNADMYNDPDTCPEELLLFFHRIPYTYKLKSGQTLIQYIYDSHFEGACQAKELMEKWESLKGAVPEDVYERVTERFRLQVENANEWRDQINSYFYRKSDIPDEKGRKIY
ncbi:alpha-glucuronidase [Butyrivibrio sp. XB500-5]|uniref:alpha-glucuronidase family glycosyl hydrolase n=1 Tax=Butyrivibrio sp. XB500-5 TaxID=2364880 RepID=UPI000EA840D7|nr:alpha-glucuronidase family glycosyl hydrolase [Butyrivibrio sp. XB500-5]RKM57702.1 alpha-glucuronidase [Butyrivibrio sp. XB500-5]